MNDILLLATIFCGAFQKCSKKVLFYKSLLGHQWYINLWTIFTFLVKNDLCFFKKHLRSLFSIKDLLKDFKSNRCKLRNSAIQKYVRFRQKFHKIFTKYAVSRLGTWSQAKICGNMFEKYDQMFSNRSCIFDLHNIYKICGHTFRYVTAYLKRSFTYSK